MTFNGTVVSSRRAMVASEAPGIVESLSVRIGDRVRAGEILARLRSTPLQLRIDAAKAGITEAVAQLKSSQLRLDRLEELSSSDVVSRQRVDDALFEKEGAAARVEKLRADLAILEDRLERSTIRAPFGGIVAEEHTQRGEWLEAGDTVVELVSLDEVEIRLDIPEAHRLSIGVGMEARLRFISLGGREINGRVRALVPNAKANARTFPVFLRLEEKAEVGVGASVEATLSLGRAHGAVWVPRDAIVRREGQPLVFRLGQGSEVESVPVEEAADQGRWMAVLGDLAAGDSIVIEGNEALRDGQVVSAEAREYAWP